MTSNTSPEKPDWFSLIDNAAPSAQVRKVDKRVPVTTAIAAIAIMAFGAFFANGAVTSEISGSSPVTSAGVTSTGVGSVGVGSVGVSSVGVSSATKLAAPQSLTTITDPGLNGGEEMDEDEDEELENYQDDEDEDEDEDRD